MNFRAPCCIITDSNAGVMELVDVVDSKSTASDGVPVRVRPPAPNNPNTLDQWAKSPVISRCSGFFMTGNFQSIPWINGSGSEVQTGFEPLLFHFQGDFRGQRPFSEGRDDRFSEKTKKNLSQSYGCWIVGFHEPMTSALFVCPKAQRIYI